MKYNLTICWLYPDLMNTYGDRGNVIVLQRRCEWRGINVHLTHHSIGSPISDIKKADMLFMGGSQDFQQEIVSKDIEEKKGDTIKEKIESGTPGLFICGAYQFLGNYYKAADGTKIAGLGIFDMHTEHPGDQKKRLIGNVVIKPNSNIMDHYNNIYYHSSGIKNAANTANLVFVGFENHGGRSYLGKNLKPFATVQKGNGNNDIDNTEGALYKNSIGTYLHGPILPKNPEVADWLIHTALKEKYREDYSLPVLDDSLEKKAREAIINRL